MDPSYNNSNGVDASAGGAGSGGVGAGSNAGGVPQSQFEAQFMQSLNAQPADNGGDIILNNGGSDGKKRKKIILITVAAVVLVAVVVLSIIAFAGRGGGGGGDVASGVKGAYNVYANYFLTGEASATDVELEATPSEEEIINDTEDAVEGEVLQEDEVRNISIDYDENGNIIYLNENDEVIPKPSWVDDAGVVEEVIEETVEEGTEDVENVGNSNIYFFTDVMDARGDEVTQYLQKLQGYFDSFYDEYVNEDEKDGELNTDVVNLLDENDRYLKLISIYLNNPDFSQVAILEAYNTGGEDAAMELIAKNAELYNEVEPINEVNMNEAVLNYGQGELLAIRHYAENGCIVNGVIDADCVELHYTAEDERIEDTIAEAYENYRGTMEYVINKLYTNINVFYDLVYGEETANE